MQTTIRPRGTVICHHSAIKRHISHISNPLETLLGKGLPTYPHAFTKGVTKGFTMCFTKAPYLKFFLIERQTNHSRSALCVRNAPGDLAFSVRAATRTIKRHLSRLIDIRCPVLPDESGPQNVTFRY